MVQMTYLDPKDSSTAELLRLIDEDRAESAPPQTAKEKTMTVEADMQHRLRWLSTAVCMPTWTAAAHYLVALTRRHRPDLELNLLGSGSLRDVSGAYLTRVAEALESDAVMAAAWRLLALLPQDATVKRWETVAAAQGLLKLSDGDVIEPQTRLELWKTAEFVEGSATEFFAIAETEWRKVSHAADDATPICVRLLEEDTWPEAFNSMHEATTRVAGPLGIKPPARDTDRKTERAKIAWIIEELFDQNTDECGELALAWQMMLCDPEKPESFNAVLPQLTWLLRHKTSVTGRRQARLRGRLDAWWLATRGEWVGSKPPVSIFRIAEREADKLTYADDFPTTDLTEQKEPPAPTVVVLRKDRAEEKGLPQAWRDLRDEPLPLVVCRDAAAVREQLQAEYPHAHREVAMLTQDLRSGEPVRIKPTLLLSQPGTGKTRLIRRLAEIISPDLYVSRFDAASTFDGMFGGTPRAGRARIRRCPRARS
ncbi:hypothetical protein ACTGJ9_013330 [Bradyrhizobium sp. RDM12]